jgi:hypothetical protein
MPADILAVEVKPVLKSTMSKMAWCFLVPQILYKSYKAMKDPTAKKAILQQLPHHRHRVFGLFTSFGLHFAFAGLGCAGGRALGSKIRGTC